MADSHRRLAIVAAVSGVVALVTAGARANLPPGKRPPPSVVDYRPPPRPREIAAVISSNRAAIKACYERALLRDTALADGSAVVTLHIGISGRPKHIQVDGPPRFRQLEPCLKDAIARWVFPQASEEYPVQLPLVLPSGEDQNPEEQSARDRCSITISSVPWADLWLDGKDTGWRTPVVDYKLPCGKHKLGFKRPALKINKTRLIHLRRGDPFDRSYTLTARTAGRR